MAWTPSVTLRPPRLRTSWRIAAAQRAWPSYVRRRGCAHPHSSPRTPSLTPAHPAWRIGSSPRGWPVRCRCKPLADRSVLRLQLRLRHWGAKLDNRCNCEWDAGTRTSAHVLGRLAAWLAVAARLGLSVLQLACCIGGTHTFWQLACLQARAEWMVVRLSLGASFVSNYVCGVWGRVCSAIVRAAQPTNLKRLFL